MKKLIAAGLFVNALLLGIRAWQEVGGGTAAALATEFILDNGQAGTSWTGTWSVSGAGGFYGANSLFARNGPTYTYTFADIPSGEYDVHEWHTTYASRSTAVPYEIQHAGGTRVATVNQQLNGGKWNLLGTFTFGGTARVKITAVGTASTCADAVRIVRKSVVSDLPLVLAELAQHLSVENLPIDDQGSTAKTFRLTGVNLQIVNGLGATNGNPEYPQEDEPAHTATNGLGNLIVGYQEWEDYANHVGDIPGPGRTMRDGSHCIVLGAFNDYSSFGGIIAGKCSTVTGAYAVAHGDGGFSELGPGQGGGQEKFGNSATGDYASAIGGTSNLAIGKGSSVTGGWFNEATGWGSSVSGGAYNRATGTESSVSGGAHNRATGTESSVSGGYMNLASGTAASVSGGDHNEARGDFSTVSGGTGLTALGGHLP